MDLSEPRTVDEQIASIKKIKLVNPAQINEMIEENTKKRLNMQFLQLKKRSMEKFRLLKQL